MNDYIRVSKYHMRKSVPAIISFLLILSVFLQNSFTGIQIAAAQTNGFTPEQAIDLSVDQTVTGTFDDADTFLWFKVDPTDAVFEETHLMFETFGDLDTELFFYSSLENAQNDSYQYSDDDSGDGNNAYVEVPIAWSGSYYLKVYAYEAGQFTIGATPIALPPEDHPNSGACALEVTMGSKPSALEMLSTIRSIRDQLLLSSSRGKEITELYYKASPQLITSVLTDKSLRKDVYDTLVSLQPLIEAVNKKTSGKNTAYTVSEQDQEAIQKVKELLLPELTDDLREEAIKLWDRMELDDIQGMDVETLLEETGLSTAKSKSVTSKGRIIVKFKEGANEKQKLGQTLRKFDVSSGEIELLATADRQTRIADTYVVTLEDSNDVSSALQKLQDLSSVEYVQVDQVFKATSSDVNYSSQWALENTGQFEGDIAADIGYKELNKQLKNSKLTNTLVAVIDTGVNYSLADLEDNVRVDLGYDFVNDDEVARDDHDHGTHVSGVIAAKSDNGFSMAGINPYAQIIPIKVLDDQGSGYSSDIALGIRYAVDKGAKVINLSLGSSSFDQVIESALEYAASKNVTVVAAAGNDGEEEISYPASSKYAISVGASTSADELADFSNYGKGLDIVAPGEKIASLVTNGNVQYANGTSMASPHVAAVASLLYSQKPSISRTDVEKVLFQNTKDLGKKGYDTIYGNGRLDAYKAFMSGNTGSNPTGKVKSLKVDPSKLELMSGDKKQVTVTATYTDGTTADVTSQAKWTSKSSSVANYADGFIEGKKAGKTTITAEFAKKKVTINVTVKERTPVILIPGIGGSQLYTEDDDLSWIGVWEVLANAPIIHDLELEPEKDGSTKMISKNDVKIHTSSVNYGLYGISQLTSINNEEAVQYAYMIEDLVKEGYIPGKTLFGMPYDWRMNISDHHKLLKQTISTALKESGASKVNIVAHSMGGLLVKDYLLANKTAGKQVNSVITIGTPFLGAAKASKALIMGDNFDIPFLQDKTGYTIAKHAPSVYQLAPSSEYNSVMTKKYGRSVYAYVDQSGEYHNQTLDELNEMYPYQPLVGVAENTHKALDKKYVSVKQYHIVGDNQPTITGINQWQLYDGMYPNHIDFLMANGDGTVPLFSAESAGASKAKLFYANNTSGHAALVKEEPVRKKVMDLLKGDEKSKVDGIDTTPSRAKIDFMSYSFSGEKDDFEDVSLRVTNQSTKEALSISFTKDGIMEVSGHSESLKVESGVLDDQLFIQVIVPRQEEIQLAVDGGKKNNLRLISYQINDKKAYNHSFFGNFVTSLEIVQEDRDFRVYEKGKRVKGTSLELEK
ncbi:MAG TPA: S8 family serine peptidase [Candidatus Bathyarchaeia archaeon]|nr:S8 family serine peptidase [Candidatus Bathyarchaeia archaeon]